MSSLAYHPETTKLREGSKVRDADNERFFDSRSTGLTLRSMPLCIAMAGLLAGCGGTADGFVCDEVLGFCKLPRSNEENNNDDEEGLTEEEMEAARAARINRFMRRSASSRRDFQIAPRSRIPND